MKKELIKNYISKITKDDIISYIAKENVYANEEEVDLIYNAIKNDYEYLLNNDFMKYISNYKLNINEDLYNKIIEKYNEYKKFIE